jgi:hypothetical protein
MLRRLTIGRVCRAPADALGIDLVSSSPDWQLVKHGQNLIFDNLGEAGCDLLHFRIAESSLYRAGAWQFPKIDYRIQSANHAGVAADQLPAVLGDDRS